MNVLLVNLQTSFTKENVYHNAQITIMTKTELVTNVATYVLNVQVKNVMNVLLVQKEPSYKEPNVSNNVYQDTTKMKPTTNVNHVTILAENVVDQAKTIVLLVMLQIT